MTAIVHKTYTIQLASYRRKIGWIPKATVKPPDESEKNHTIAGKPKDPLKKLRMRQPRRWQLNGSMRSFPLRLIKAETTTMQNPSRHTPTLPAESR